MSMDHISVDIDDHEKPRSNFSLPTLRSSLFHVDSSEDDKMLKRVIADAGRWASWVISVQLWVLNEDKTRLVQPSAGWWLDDVFHDCENDRSCKLCRLVDPTRGDYVPAKPCPIGVGLAGVLWGLVQGDTPKVVWREIRAIASDPDQPWEPRLQLLAECGFGMAGAVPFSVLGEEGIIICLTREDFNLEKLRSPKNEAYLLAAAQLIGSTFVFRGPRREAVDERRQLLKDALRRARNKILALRAFGVNIENLAEKQPESSSSRFPTLSVNFSKINLLSTSDTPTVIEFGCNPRNWIPRSFQRYIDESKVQAAKVVKKFRGAGVQPPPAFSFEQAVWTFAGCMITMCVLSQLNFILIKHLGEAYEFPITPFGSYLTLLYALTAAPAAQPRTAMLAQVICLSMSLLISLIDFIAVWVRVALVTSLAISIMSKLGITHPPAGAAALLFANSDFGWITMAFFLIGNVIAIALAVVINNLSNKRQYPTYWGFQPFLDFFSWLLFFEEKK